MNANKLTQMHFLMKNKRTSFFLFVSILSLLDQARERETKYYNKISNKSDLIQSKE